MGGKRTRESAEAALARLQLRMLEIQQACFCQGRRAVLVFVGPDAAGKGGAIRRMVERLDPRGVKVWPIGPPDEHERAHHYLRRFWVRLPARGEIAVFDRSWYGRVLVERVEKLAPKPTWKRAYGEINEFENLLLGEGAPVVKIYVAISKREQLRRFRERALVPYKRYKLTEDDIRAHLKWNEYEKARAEMLKRTSTRLAPWHVVQGDDKLKARVEILRIVTEALGRGMELKPPELAKPVRLGLEKLLGTKLE
jgi:polyphosphate kinase 2 (PPK2 family)